MRTNPHSHFINSHFVASRMHQTRKLILIKIRLNKFGVWTATAAPVASHTRSLIFKNHSQIRRIAYFNSVNGDKLLTITSAED